MTNFRHIAITFAFILAPACASDNLSTKGQLIECSVAADGTTSNCHPTDQTETDDPDKCIDVDEDGDDDPADDDANDEKVSRLVTPDDEDGDGTPDSEDDDDDDDGVPDVDDCDEEAGGDGDEPDDDDSVDDDL